MLARSEVTAAPGSLRRLIAAAEAEVETVELADALKLHGDPGVVFVDVRDPREVWRDGAIDGALHCPRDMVEFWVDPESPYAKPAFQQGKRYLFYCAAGDGWRSALSAQAAQTVGLENAARIRGGFKGWREAGGPVETREPQKGG
jgi:rhodanese-related sulfurtransferase